MKLKTSDLVTKNVKVKLNYYKHHDLLKIIWVSPFFHSTTIPDGKKNKMYINNHWYDKMQMSWKIQQLLVNINQFCVQHPFYAFFFIDVVYKFCLQLLWNWYFSLRWNKKNPCKQKFFFKLIISFLNIWMQKRYNQFKKIYCLQGFFFVSSEWEISVSQ